MVLHLLILKDLPCEAVRFRVREKREKIPKEFRYPRHFLPDIAGVSFVASSNTNARYPLQTGLSTRKAQMQRMLMTLASQLLRMADAWLCLPGRRVVRAVLPVLG